MSATVTHDADARSHSHCHQLRQVDRLASNCAKGCRQSDKVSTTVQLSSGKVALGVGTSHLSGESSLCSSAGPAERIPARSRLVQGDVLFWSLLTTEIRSESMVDESGGGAKVFDGLSSG